MNESKTLTIFTSQDGHTTRLGWISAATGLTYCGICLGSAVAPEVGEFCTCCGARVTGTFDTADGPEAIRRAWNQAGNASAIAELECLAS